MRPTGIAGASRPSAASSFLEATKDTGMKFSMISVMLINKMMIDAARVKRRAKYGEAIVADSQDDQSHQE